MSRSGYTRDVNPSRVEPWEASAVPPAADKGWGQRGVPLPPQLKYGQVQYKIVTDDPGDDAMSRMRKRLRGELPFIEGPFMLASQTAKQPELPGWAAEAQRPVPLPVHSTLTQGELDRMEVARRIAERKHELNGAKR